MNEDKNGEVNKDAVDKDFWFMSVIVGFQWLRIYWTLKFKFWRIILKTTLLINLYFTILVYF